ncbi:hypothetical protein FRC14_000866, partial [Serendipita sp. 396]
MPRLTPAVREHVLALLDSGHSGYQIYAITGVHPSTVSRIRSISCLDITKSIGGRPSKLSDTNLRHAVCLITSGKAENAVQVTKALKDITNQEISVETTRCALKRSGMKAV